MSVSSMEENLYAKLGEVIREDYPNSLVTHFTAVVTIVDNEGTEMVITLDRPEQPLWQSMGMLDFVREMRRALISQQVCEHDEDE